MHFINRLKQTAYYIVHTHSRQQQVHAGHELKVAIVKSDTQHSGHMGQHIKN